MLSICNIFVIYLCCLYVYKLTDVAVYIYIYIFIDVQTYLYGENTNICLHTFIPYLCHTCVHALLLLHIAFYGL